MADGLNKVMLIGNLGQDPELRYTQGNTAVMNIRIATTESFMNRDNERQERTEWHTVVLWGKRGEGLHKILTKGNRIFVEGRLQTRAWEDKQGQKRYTTEVVATNVILLGGAAGAGRARGAEDGAPPPSDDYAPADSSGGGGGGAAGGGGGMGDDDIPF
jgi:single-strand DNA-binding protein